MAVVMEICFNFVENCSIMTQSLRKPIKFWQKVCIHLAIMLLSAVAIFWLMTYCLDLWTHHGKSIEVPTVKGIAYEQAKEQLEDDGFEVVLNDSVYDESAFPGMVVDQNPKSGANVKPGRTVYLTINAFYPRTVVLPNLVDISVRQARATLDGLGLTNVAIERVPSDYADLVISAKVEGKRLVPGMRVPLTAHLVLEVGEGYQEPVAIPDSMEVKLTDVDDDEPLTTSNDIFD